MNKLTLNSNLEEAILKYLEYCEIERNLSQNTIKMYHFYLMDFLDWTKSFLKKEEILLSAIDYDLIKKYRLELNRRISYKSNQEFKRSTQKTFLVALRSFLKFLVVEEDLELMSPDQIILGKAEERIPKVLNNDQLKKLF